MWIFNNSENNYLLSESLLLLMFTSTVAEALAAFLAATFFLIAGTTNFSVASVPAIPIPTPAVTLITSPFLIC